MYPCGSIPGCNVILYTAVRPGCAKGVIVVVLVYLVAALLLLIL